MMAKQNIGSLDKDKLLKLRGSKFHDEATRGHWYTDMRDVEYSKSQESLTLVKVDGGWLYIDWHTTAIPAPGIVGSCQFIPADVPLPENCYSDRFRKCMEKARTNTEEA